MPPKRPASTAFKPPRRKPTTDIPTSKPRTKAGKSSAIVRRRALPANSPDASSSSSSENQEEDQEADEDDDDEEEPLSEQDSPSDGSSSSAFSPAPLPARRPAVAAARSGSRPRSPDGDLGEDADGPPVMPEKLLTALLYSHFQQTETKIGREARDLVGKYVETFVREAVARAIVERKGVAGGGDFLEVEDLEKLAPQLILDF